MLAALLLAALALAGEHDGGEKSKVRGPFLDLRSSKTMNCPAGTHPVEGGGARGARCAMDREASSLLPAPSRGASVEAPPMGFQSVETAGLRALFPKGWHVTDDWNDDVPTLSVEHDVRRGKPVTLMVSRLDPGKASYEAVDAAIAQEREFHGAVEGPARRVAGRPARQISVAGLSRSVYVDVGGGSYLLFVYSAPAEDFRTFESAFERLLTSARLK
jgi:hypothetical protein